MRMEAPAPPFSLLSEAPAAAHEVVLFPMTNPSPLPGQPRHSLPAKTKAHPPPQRSSRFVPFIARRWLFLDGIGDRAGYYLVP